MSNKMKKFGAAGASVVAALATLSIGSTVASAEDDDCYGTGNVLFEGPVMVEYFAGNCGWIQNGASYEGGGPQDPRSFIILNQPIGNENLIVSFEDYRGVTAGSAREGTYWAN